MVKKVGIGVGVMILRDGKVLLGKRHVDKDKADSELRGEGTWTMPGGKLDYDEGFLECAKREVMEETGIVLNKVKVICVNNDKNEYSHFVTIGLFCDDFGGEVQVLEPDEITEWKWFSLDKLPSPMFFPSKKLLRNYLEGEFFIQDEI
ncbi:NUDIX domain-containing protein [Candidatus Pacearchaeota archaeon]|nr:NUDIX domain-containing protein [Candidatus Pacearchaeota archaeon]